MSNHVHILIETQGVGVSKIMLRIPLQIGHLFQGRYQAILCDRAAYLLEMVRYIHLKSARRASPENPWRYRCSSQSAYLGKSSPVKVVSEAVLRQFNSKVGTARRAFRRFVEEGLKKGHNESYYQTIDQGFLGEESFIENVAERAGAKDIQIKGKKPSFVRLLQAVALCTG